VRVVGREVDGALPVEAERALAEFVARRDALGPGAALGVAVEAEVVAELEAGVDEAVRAGVYGHLHPVAAEEALPGVVALAEPVLVGLVGARAHPDAVGLDPAVGGVLLRHGVRCGL